MRKMLKPAMDNKSMLRKTGTISHDEMGIKSMQDIHQSALQEDWTPDQRRMTDNDHLAVYPRLTRKTAKDQAAASK